jgi:hypothetical protein
MHAPINGVYVEQVAERMGYPPVVLDDFVSVGCLQATAHGLALCQSNDFACLVHHMLEQFEEADKGPEEIECTTLLYTAMSVCTEEGGFVEVDNEGTQMTAFMNENKKSLARLLLPAIAMRYPGVLEEMGFASAK